MDNRNHPPPSGRKLVVKLEELLEALENLPPPPEEEEEWVIEEGNDLKGEIVLVGRIPLLVGGGRDTGVVGWLARGAENVAVVARGEEEGLMEVRREERRSGDGVVLVSLEKGEGDRPFSVGVRRGRRS